MTTTHVDCALNVTTPDQQPVPMLEVAGLRRHFGSVAAVDGVTLTLPAGARHAIIGPNGAGKSTLLALLAGTLRPTAGHIRLAGRAITYHGPARRCRAGIARSFQTPALFPTLSTVDNLVIASWRHAGPGPRRHRLGQLRHQAIDMLDQLGLAAEADRPAGSLSHGQQRLLDITMALVGHPKIVLLDEPAAGLDSPADLHRVLDLLQSVATDTAVLLVEHHLDVVAALADTVSCLHHGRVLATGTPAEVTTHPDVQAAFRGLEKV